MRLHVTLVIGALARTSPRGTVVILVRAAVGRSARGGGACGALAGGDASVPLRMVPYCAHERQRWARCRLRAHTSGGGRAVDCVRARAAAVGALSIGAVGAGGAVRGLRGAGALHWLAPHFSVCSPRGLHPPCKERSSSRPSGTIE